MITGVWSPIVRSVIRRSLRFGWSGNRIYNALPDIGLPKYHRSTFLAVVRAERDFLNVQEPTLKHPRHLKFPQELMVEESFPAEFRYKIFGRAQYRDMTTGELFRDDVSMYVDYDASPDMWEQEFLTRFTHDPSDPSARLLAFTTLRVSHNEGWAY